MELKDILSKCDHTLLSQTATWDEIRGICDDGMKYGCASVMHPASYVKQAAEYAAENNARWNCIQMGNRKSRSHRFPWNRIYCISTM